MRSFRFFQSNRGCHRALTALGLAAGLSGFGMAAAQEVGGIPTPLTQPPKISDTTGIIVDKLKAQILGKALFWDINAGSDGMACASCHFQAGADIRIQNQVNPGHDGKFDYRAPTPIETAGLARLAPDSIDGAPRPTNARTGPNKRFTVNDFPFRKLSDNSDRLSEPTFDTNDRFSSAGTFSGQFISVGPLAPSADAQGAGSPPYRKLLPGPRHRESLPPLARWGSGPFAPKTLAGVSRLRRQGPTEGANNAPASQAGVLPNENCILTYDPANNPFHARNRIFRKVEPRQTPSVINAAYHRRLFWDGRANNIFNGLDPFGRRTNQNGGPNTGIVVLQPNGTLKIVQIELPDGALASQAVGPPLSSFEMSCAGRVFADIGDKLLPLQPLANQEVRHDDSLFGTVPGLVTASTPPAKGLNTTYAQLIKEAFDPKYWAAPGKYVISDAGIVEDPNGYTQMELNFAFFWGLAIQEYEALLVSDQTPFDLGTMSPAAQRGFDVFLLDGNCVACHKGPLFNGARQFAGAPPGELARENQFVERMLMGDGGAALYDSNFYNIGVRPTFEDKGVGDKDPYGITLSLTRQYKQMLLTGADPIDPDAQNVDPCKFQIPFDFTIVPDCGAPITPAQAAQLDQLGELRVAVDGAFKVPTLRNVGANPPYMHNGGLATLRQVIDFYDRGGDRHGDGQVNQGCTVGNPALADTTGFINDLPGGNTPKTGENNCSNLDPAIRQLNLTEDQKNDLLAFLLELTDNRVLCHSGIFDHPSLPLSLGHSESGPEFAPAPDIVHVLPATGVGGLPAIGKPCFPNTGNLFGQMQTTFMEILGPPVSGGGNNCTDPNSCKQTTTTGPAATSSQPTTTTGPAATGSQTTTTGPAAGGPQAAISRPSTPTGPIFLRSPDRAQRTGPTGLQASITGSAPFRRR